MELRQLRAFLAVADERSFTRAAERLFVVQWAVSAAVRSLERELGAELIDRSTAPVGLTDAGATLLDYARQTVSSAEAAVQAVRHAHGAVAGLVRLGFVQARRSSVLNVPVLLDTFGDIYPDVRIDARHVSGSTRAAELLRRGELDVALLALPPEDADGLDVTPLWVEPLRLVCARSHRLADAASVTLDQLRELDFAALPDDWGVSLTVDAWLARHEARLDVTHTVNDVRAVTDFAARDLACVLLPASFVRHDPRLRIVPITGAPRFTTLLATPAGRRVGPATEEFGRWLRQRIADSEAPPGVSTARGIADRDDEADRMAARDDERHEG